MRFFGLVAAVAISALGFPAFGAPAPNLDSVEFHSLAARNSSLVANDGGRFCVRNSLDIKTTAASPLVTDCQKVASNIMADGAWQVGWPAIHQIVQWGTCAVGVRVVTQFTVMKLGNLDVIDFINDSIAQFSWNGYVGAEANMNCPDIIDDDDSVTAKGTFGLFHTSDSP